MQKLSWDNDSGFWPYPTASKSSGMELPQAHSVGLGKEYIRILKPPSLAQLDEAAPECLMENRRTERCSKSH